MSALRADFVASYNFSSSTGITLTNGSAGGTAAIAGGVDLIKEIEEMKCDCT
jgi:hypothetical protein